MYTLAMHTKSLQKFFLGTGGKYRIGKKTPTLRHWGNVTWKQKNTDSVSSDDFKSEFYSTSDVHLIQILDSNVQWYVYLSNGIKLTLDWKKRSVTWRHLLK